MLKSFEEGHSSELAVLKDMRAKPQMIFFN
jgi:hypothetical protein